jgi:hypothetical protein
MSGMYWGLTAMALLGRLDEMDTGAVAAWVLSCRKDGGGFGASPRNDAHLLYTLSAVQASAGARARACVAEPRGERACRGLGEGPAAAGGPAATLLGRRQARA